MLCEPHSATTGGTMLCEPHSATTGGKTLCEPHSATTGGKMLCGPHSATSGESLGGDGLFLFELQTLGLFVDCDFDHLARLDLAGENGFG